MTSRLIKRLISGALVLTLVFSINGFAAVVTDNDGSAFITKAEFDSLKNSFQAQIDSYNQAIDSKIDGAIAAYLAGITLIIDYDQEVITEKIKDLFWYDNIQLEYQRANDASTTTGKGPADTLGFGQVDSDCPAVFLTDSAWIQNVVSGIKQINGGGSRSCYAVNFYRDDAYELVYHAYELKTNQTYQVLYPIDTWEKRIKNIVGLESAVGSVSGTLISMQPGLFAYPFNYSHYASNHILPPQSNYRPADPVEHGSGYYKYMVESGDDNYLLKPIMQLTSGAETLYNCNYPLQKYYGLQTLTIRDKQGTADPYNYKYKLSSDKDMIKKFMPGKKLSYYVATVAPSSTTSLGTSNSSYDGFKWGTGHQSFFTFTTKTLYSEAYAAKTPKERYTNNLGSTNPKLSSPNWYSHDLLVNYKNNLLAQDGLDVKFQDGAPFFKAGADGVAHVIMDVARQTYANSTNTNPEKVQINIREGKFTNDIVGNGNQLMETDADGMNIGYLQNKTASEGQFDFYFKVTKGTTYYLRISPDDATGEYMAKINNVSVHIKNQD